MRRALLLLLIPSGCGSRSKPGGDVTIVVTDAGTKYFLADRGWNFSVGFSLRVTSLEGAAIEDTLPGVGKFDANAGVASHANFQ